MKIFISHAWDDKAFVRPLAEALRADGYEVWFDEYEFKVGDSLLGKINEGLLSADYGVVVFSRAFFTKYWTKTELDGLMALEAKNGKMVLPVWLDIRAVEIAELMPTFAGRYAVSADKGLDRVVAEIRAAIDGADRQRELSRGSSAKARIQKLSAERKARKTADSLLHSTKGVQLAGAEASRLMDAAQQSITAVSTDELPFKGTREGNQLEVQAPSRLRLRIHYEDILRDGIPVYRAPNWTMIDRIEVNSSPSTGA